MVVAADTSAPSIAMAATARHSSRKRKSSLRISVKGK